MKVIRAFAIKQLLATTVLLFSTAVLATTAAPDKKPEGVAIGSAGFEEMLGKQLGSDALKTEALPDGSFTLTNTVQTLRANVGRNGTVFSSTSKEANRGGAFSLGITLWGREHQLQAAISSQIYRDGDTVFHTYADGIAEKFSNTGSGIRQDFIIPVKPQGDGVLQVQLKVEGATLVSKDNGFSVALDNSQRTLTYDRLQVTDASNKVIAARMLLQSDNTITIAVDDSVAQYPLTIDPTVGDVNWVSMGEIVPGADGPVYAIARSGADIYRRFFHGGQWCGGKSYCQMEWQQLECAGQWGGWRC